MDNLAPGLIDVSIPKQTPMILGDISLWPNFGFTLPPPATGREMELHALLETWQRCAIRRPGNHRSVGQKAAGVILRETEA